MPQPLGQLSARFSGLLVQPNDPDFDDLRRVHNGLVDRHPALIARCRSAQDVADVVKFAAAPASRLPCAAAATTSPGARPAIAAS